MILTVPNALSVLRFPLALVFLQEDIFYRCLALLIAMATDGLDGFIARRYKQISRLGTTLDPIADKFFVAFVLSIFLGEGQISLVNALSMISRDIAVALFGVYLFSTNKLGQYQFRSIWSGKASTFLQFIVLLGLTWGYRFPAIVYWIFVVFGIWAFIELYNSRKQLLVKD